MNVRLLKPACLILSVCAVQSVAFASTVQAETDLQAGMWAYRKHDYQSACSKFEKALKSEDVSRSDELRAVVLFQLGLAQMELKDYQKAESTLVQCLDIRSKILRPTNPELVQTCKVLIKVCEQTKDFEQEVKCYERQIAAFKGLFGGNSQQALSLLFEMTVARERLADTYKAHNKLDDQEKELNSVLEVRRQLLGQEQFDAGHHTIAAPLLNLAIIKIKQHKPAEARPLMKRSLSAITADMNRFITYLWEMEVNCMATGQALEAEPYLMTSIAAREKLWGPQSKGLAGDLTRLAEVRILQGKNDQAESLLKRAQSIMSASGSGSKDDLAMWKTTYLDFLKKTNRSAESAGIEQTAERIKINEKDWPQ